MNWLRRITTTTHRFRPAAPALAIGFLLFVLSLPLLIVVHEVALAAAASLLEALVERPQLRDLLHTLPLDPIYTNAAIETFGRISTSGIAIGGAVGAFLHDLWPRVFASPDLSEDGISVVLHPGSSIMAQGIVLLVARVSLLALGLVVARTALGPEKNWTELLKNKRRGTVLVLGLLVQAMVVWQALGTPPELGELDALGMSFAFGVLFPALTGRRLALSDLNGSFGGVVTASAAAALTLVAAYVLAWLSANLLRAAYRRSAPLAAKLPAVRRMPRPQRRLAMGLVALVVPFSMSLGVISAKSQPLPDQPEIATEPLELHAPEAPVPIRDDRTLFITKEPPRVEPDKPSSVEISGEAYTFRYKVNGRPQFIRGMGYNPIYRQLTPDERAARYDRDFAMMKRSFVNTVFGWTTQEFDGLLLDKAQFHGLGVAMPYDLSPQLDYTSVELQAQLRRDVLQWVDKYKDYPALRMWAVGNEVLHKVVFPSWLPLSRNSAQSVARAKAFARFYVGLIDAIRQADPNHPVLLRDAEDAYFSWIRDALRAQPANRTWFMYGTNIYTKRLNDVVEGWPKQNAGIPLLISEFAPGGVSSRDRPDGYRAMWTTLAKRRDWTLGGVPYVWTTAGPEEVDRAFGLVDANATPVDGSLKAISAMFVSTPDVETKIRRGAQIN